MEEEKEIKRPYRCHFDGHIVDLDNPETYNYLPKTKKELHDRILKEFGYTTCYMNYLHKDWFTPPREGGQRKRIEDMIAQYSTPEYWYTQDILKLQEFCFLFEDEIENMC